MVGTWVRYGEYIIPAKGETGVMRMRTNWVYSIPGEKKVSESEIGKDWRDG